MIKRKLIMKIVLLLLVVSSLLLRSTQYIYTYPVLTSKNLYVFGKCIELMKNNQNIQRITHHSLITNDNIFFMDEFSDMEKEFTPDEIKNIMSIAGQLNKIRFFKVERHDDFILFYTFSHWYGFTKYGCCYSISGKNPNDIQDNIVAQSKPFTQIDGNWYISKKLAPRQRTLIRFPIPEKSLFDHSKNHEEL